MFGKNCQKVLFEKTECLASTYKSDGLSNKLPKKTIYIYIYIYMGVYFILKSTT